MRPGHQLRRSAERRGSTLLGGWLSLALVLASACSAGKSGVPIASPDPAFPTTRGHAGEIRLGLIGGLGDQNVWALFGGERYSYNDYAVRAHYWPRLYELTPAAESFEPRLASGMPTSMRAEGAFQTASVRVRTDLRWSDQTAFTAQDVAFTVNAVLQFELGFDWADFYDRRSLDHAEAIAPDTVKFFFKSPPGVQGWQLGALQGPIAQAGYWAPKVADAAELLPTEETRARISTLQEEIARLQAVVNGLYAQVPTAQGEQARDLQADLRRQQGNLDKASNDLAKEEARLEEALKAARLALFKMDDVDEPTLGAWERADGSGKAQVTNLPNPDYPGPRPNFDHAIYVVYPSANGARQALAAGAINLILDPAADAAPSAPRVMVSASRSLRFLVFNANSPLLQDETLRAALACMLDQQDLAGRIGSAVELSSVIPQQEAAWHDPQARLPCAGMDSTQRLAQAVDLLRSKGYAWEREPAAGQPGQGLKLPDMGALPAMRLMAPRTDEQRKQAADFIAGLAGELGIQVAEQIIAPDELDYSLLSSGDFDAAVVGWRVGAYPAYLCEWFNAGGTFSYEPSTLPSLCGELQAATDLEQARDRLFAIQRALASEVPLIPLYSVAVTEGMYGIEYPFASVLDGLVGVYGAPELAIPSAP